MTDAPPPERYFVGIDVSKDQLDLARTDSPGGRTRRAFANDAAGIRELIDALRTPAAPSVIVVEATGRAASNARCSTRCWTPPCRWRW